MTQAVTAHASTSCVRLDNYAFLLIAGTAPPSTDTEAEAEAAP